MTQTNPSLKLPQFRIDYAAGVFASTLTGEVRPELTCVIVAHRYDRVLWPEAQSVVRLPECVNGSKYGPCALCRFARWGAQGEPPMCSEEIALLIRVNGTLSTLTARRSMMRPLEQYFGMKEMMGTPVFDQEVKLHLQPVAPRAEWETGLHVLRVTPGTFLPDGQVQDLLTMLPRIESLFGVNGEGATA